MTATQLAEVLTEHVKAMHDYATGDPEMQPYRNACNEMLRLLDTLTYAVKETK